MSIAETQFLKEIAKAVQELTDRIAKLEKELETCQRKSGPKPKVSE